MANDQSSHLGMRPVKMPHGNFQIGYYRANTAANLFLYQPVALNNSGQVQIAAIAALSPILGTIVGFVDAAKASIPTNMDSLGDAPYLPSLTGNAWVAVADDPHQLFIMEEDTGGTLIGSANSSGQTVRFTYIATTGDTVTGVGNALIDRSTIAATTGEILTLVGPADNMNQDGTVNDLTLAYAKWYIRINSHQNAPDRHNMSALGLPG